jgi:hypothetical protein
MQRRWKDRQRMDRHIAAPARNDEILFRVLPQINERIDIKLCGIIKQGEWLVYRLISECIGYSLCMYVWHRFHSLRFMTNAAWLNCGQCNNCHKSCSTIAIHVFIVLWQHRVVYWPTSRYNRTILLSIVRRFGTILQIARKENTVMQWPHGGLVRS